MSLIEECLVVFAKAPEPGRVKTRLKLPPHQAAKLHSAFVRDVVERHQKVDRSLVVWRAGDLNHPFWSELSVALAEQPEGQLGTKMRHAFEVELNRSNKVVIVGTDSPSLPPEMVDAAFLALDTHPVVLGPACDGGYYLVGARGPVPDIFPVDMPWGTESVLRRTLTCLLEQDVSCGLTPFWYDVDRPEDLLLLQTHLQTATGIGPEPRHALAILEELLGNG